MIRIYSMLLLTAATAYAGVSDDINMLTQPTASVADKRMAAQRLSKADPAVLLELLKAWPKDDPVAANWLRATFDDLASYHAKQLPTADLLMFANNAKQHGKSRRAAFAAIERQQPGTLTTQLPKLLNDPEFGADAVALLMEQAEAATDPAQTKRLLQDAYTAATDVEQVQTLAKRLTAQGEKPNLARKLGLVSAWHLVGPFDVGPAEGLKQSFPPESKIDLTATYPAKTAPLAWKAVNADAEGKIDVIKNGVNPSQGSVVYLVATVRVPQETTAELRIGVVDNVTAWVNGNEVLKQASLYRSHFRGDRHRVTVKLNAGVNTLLLKLTKTPPEEGGRPGAPPKWDTQVRFVLPNGQGVDFTSEENK